MTVAIRKRGGVRNPSAPRLNRENPLRQSPRILDSTPGAAAAYSLRRLSSAYTGPLVRVRRSADNTELDISADTAGNLNEKSLMDFVGTENLFPKSNIYETGTWGRNAVSVTQVTTGGPSGVTEKYGTLIRTSLISNYLAASVSKPATAMAMCFSVYAKKDTAKYLAFRMQGSFPSYANLVVDIETGTISVPAAANASFSNAAASVVSVGGGWFRISFSATTDAVTAVGCYISPNMSGGLIDYGDTSSTASVHVAAAQLNYGSTPQAYTETTGGATGTGYVTKWYDQSGQLSNRITNGHFETDISGWSNGIGGGATGTLARSTSISSSGIASLQIDVTGTQTVPGGGPYYQLIAALPGDTVTASANIRTTVLGKKLRIELVFRDASSNYITSLPGPDTELTSIGTWYTATASVVAPANTAFVSLAIYAAPTSTVWTTGDRLYVDDVSLTRSGVYNDMPQAAASLQPFIVSNGAVHKINGRPALKYEGSQKLSAKLTNNSGLTAFQSCVVSAFSVAEPYRRVFSVVSDAPVNDYDNAYSFILHQHDGTTSNDVAGWSLVRCAAASFPSLNTNYVCKSSYNGTTHEIQINGGVINTATASGTVIKPNYGLYLSAYRPTAGDELKGSIAEVIFWPSNVESVYLTADQMKFYGIQAG